jgi:hypothetical protein
MRLRFCGLAVVFSPDGSEVHDPGVLRQFHGYRLDEYATDYIGGTPLEDGLVAAMERSGEMWFEYRAGYLLQVFMEFKPTRKLTEAELAWLKPDVLGQWSDGMGECVFIESGPLKDYKLQPLSPQEAGEPEYPHTEWIA